MYYTGWSDKARGENFWNGLLASRPCALQKGITLCKHFYNGFSMGDVKYNGSDSEFLFTGRDTPFNGEGHKLETNDLWEAMWWCRFHRIPEVNRKSTKEEELKIFPNGGIWRCCDNEFGMLYLTYNKEMEKPYQLYIVPESLKLPELYSFKTEAEVHTWLVANGRRVYGLLCRK